MKTILSLFLAVSFLPATAFAKGRGISPAEVRALVAQIKRHHDQALAKVNPGASLLGYFLSPEHPVQGDKVTLFAQVQTNFSGQETIVSGNLDGTSVGLQQPSADLFLYEAGSYGTIGKHTFQGSFYVQNHSDAVNLRNAIAQINAQIISLQAQISAATDPNVVAQLTVQLNQAQAQQAQLTASLANLKTLVSQESFSFRIAANTTSPDFPHISGISPNVAHVGLAEQITIAGTNFPANPVVTIGGQGVAISSSSSTSIVGTAPAIATTGSQDLVATFSNGGQTTNAILKKAFFVMNGFTGNPAPVAVANATSSQISLGSAALFNSTGSNDPQQGALAYQWQLISVPAGSQVPVPSTGTSATYSVTPDVPGSYVASLVITSAASNLSSAPSLAVVQATAASNQAPQLTGGSISTFPSHVSTLQLGLSDETWQAHSYVVTRAPSLGTVSVSASGLVSYSAGSTAGNDFFDVMVLDNGTPPLSATVTIPVTIILNHAPTASAPGISTNPGGNATSQISAADQDSGQTLSYAISTQPTSGTASISSSGLVSYTANSGSASSDSIGVTVSDDGFPVMSATISIPVSIVNRAPTASAPGVGVISGGTVTSQVTASDPDAGQTLSYAISTAPTHGTATISSSGLVTFTAESSSGASDSIGIIVSDNGSPVLSATISIPVSITPNHAPTASAPSISMGSGATKTSQVSASDQDPGQILSYAIQTAPAKGTATVSSSGLVTFQANAGSSGSDSLVARVSDNGVPALFADVNVPITIAAAPVVPTPLFFRILSQGVPYQIGLSLSSQATPTGGITSPTGSITSVVWDFGDGTHETTSDKSQAAINHNYVATGSYTAKVTAFDSFGGSTSQSFAVNVVNTDIPVAKFFVNPSNGGNGTLPVTLTFDASASSDSNGITQYRWLFCGQGSETVTTSPTIQHTFTTASVCTVRLRVRDSNVAEGSVSVPVTVGSASTGVKVQAAYQVGPPREVALGTTLSFDGTRSLNPNGSTGAIGTWNWNFQDFVTCPNPNGGCTATGSTTSYTYPIVSNFFPTLQVVSSTSSTNVSNTFSQEVFVVSQGHAPHAHLESSAISGVAPLTVNLDGSGSYDYDGTIQSSTFFEPGAVPVAGPTTSYTFSTPGSFFINLLVRDNDGNTDSFAQLYTVTSSKTDLPKPREGGEYDPDREYQRQLLSSACYQGSASACSDLGDMYSEDGDSTTSANLKARACEMGYQAACPQ